MHNFTEDERDKYGPQEKQKQLGKLNTGAIRTTTKWLKGIGWVSIVLSVLFIFSGFSGSEVNASAFGLITKFAITIPGFLSGLLFVGMGQLIQCLLGIYDNTYELNQLFQQQINKNNT